MFYFLDQTWHWHKFTCVMPRSVFYKYDKATGTVVECEHEVRKADRANWPLAVEALAVSPQHIKEQKVWDRNKGLRSTEYDENGSPIVTGPGHYRELKRAHGVIDRAGYDR